jgi:multidrug transporter EmrE-like cation transporter
MSLYNVILVSLFEIAGDFSFEQYANTEETSSLGWGLTWYGIMIFFLIKALKQRNILFVNASWDGVSAVLETLAAMLILGQTLNNTNEYIGLALIISGLTFMYK